MLARVFPDLGVLAVTVNHVAGGFEHIFIAPLNSFGAFNEATGLWEELPSMPHACGGVASGVIGNELFIAGGYGEGGVDLLTLQIYDIAGGSWRLGAALPEPRTGAIGVVADGKLSVIARLSRDDLLVYDPRTDTWTEEASPRCITYIFGKSHLTLLEATSACAHNGRLVVFGGRALGGRALERANDGSWSPYQVAAGGLEHYDLAESVILG